MITSSIKRISTRPAVRHVLRYALSFLVVLGALLGQGALQRGLPPETDFPYAFFYLIAVLVSAWFGGYVPGVLACLLSMVGLPLAALQFSHVPPVDLSKLTLFIGVSLFISKVAAIGRRAHEVLRRTNDELDRRVQARTSDLNLAVEQLQSEIADHHRTEAALRESEERVAFALEGVGLGLWDFDFATGRTTRSFRHDQIYGYDTLLPEWTFETLTDHVLPQDRAHVKERFETAVRAGNLCEFECRIKRLDQAVRWIAALLLEQLRTTEQQYRRLAENAPDIVSRYELYPRRLFAYVSPVVKAISGYSSEEHYADPELGLKMVHPDDRSLLESVQRGEHPSGSTIALRWLHKSGRVIWIEQKNVLVHDHDGRLVAIEGISRDITERRKLEEQLQQAQRLESVGRLAGGVAHDFNNLLTVINGYNTMVLDELPSNSSLREYLTEVRTAGERAAALTQQLLAFSRKQVVKPTVLNVNAAIVEMQKMLRRLIGDDIDLRTNLAPDLGNVVADSGQFQQILMNLAVNSRDAMPDGGVILMQTSNVSVDESYALSHPDVRLGPYITIAVSDSGTGITPEVQALLFEPFFTTKSQGAGTGLGLAIVYGMVKQAGGWISVYSEPDHGSTFKIYLPRIDEAALQTPVVFKTDVRGHETILVVEDQPDVREVAVIALEKFGYNVYSAGSAEDALSLAGSLVEPIHLLVTDVVMAGMNGRQLADRLRNLRPGLHVLFMSGYPDDIIAHHGVVALGAAYLEKPFTADTLGEKVREMLGAEGVASARCSG